MNEIFKSKEFEDFKLTLPEDIRQECFRWIATIYSVPAALFLIKKHNLQQRNVNVKDWCKALGMAGEKEIGDENSFSFNLITGVSDKDAIKDNINPEIPIIIIEHPWKNKRKKEISILVIDGNKRLRKAFINEIETIKGYFLPERLSKLIKMN